MKKIVLAVLASLLVMMVFTGCGKINVQMGYVDVDKVLTDSPKIKSLNETNKAKFAELEKKAQALEGKAPSMNKAEYDQEYANLSKEYSAFQQQYQAQLQQIVDTALAEISQEKSLDVVVPKNTMSSTNGQLQTRQFVTNGGIDITDEVIKKLQ